MDRDHGDHPRDPRPVRSGEHWDARLMKPPSDRGVRREAIGHVTGLRVVVVPAPAVERRRRDVRRPALRDVPVESLRVAPRVGDRPECGERRREPDAVLAEEANERVGALTRDDSREARAKLFGMHDHLQSRPEGALEANSTCLMADHGDA